VAAYRVGNTIKYERKEGMTHGESKARHNDEQDMMSCAQLRVTPARPSYGRRLHASLPARGVVIVPRLPRTLCRARAMEPSTCGSTAFTSPHSPLHSVLAHGPAGACSLGFVYGLGFFWASQRSQHVPAAPFPYRQRPPHFPCHHEQGKGSCNAARAQGRCQGSANVVAAVVTCAARRRRGRRVCRHRGPPV